MPWGYQHEKKKETWSRPSSHTLFRRGGREKRMHSKVMEQLLWKEENIPLLISKAVSFRVWASLICTEQAHSVCIKSWRVTCRREVIDINYVFSQRTEQGLRSYGEVKLGIPERKSFPRTWDLWHGNELLQESELTMRAAFKQTLDHCLRRSWNQGLIFMKDWTRFEISDLFSRSGTFFKKWFLTKNMKYIYR